MELNRATKQQLIDAIHKQISVEQDTREALRVTQLHNDQLTTELTHAQRMQREAEHDSKWQHRDRTQALVAKGHAEMLVADLARKSHSYTVFYTVLDPENNVIAEGKGRALAGEKHAFRLTVEPDGEVYAERTAASDESNITYSAHVGDVSHTMSGRLPAIESALRTIEERNKQADVKRS